MTTQTSTARPNFNASRVEFDLILDIARHAVSLANEARIAYSMTAATMDITAAHNSCPLNLIALRDAAKDKPADFAHDVFGIRRHIDRNTGQLGDCFLPRFAYQNADAAREVQS